MKIGLDVYGGDNAPAATVAGALSAQENLRVIYPEVSVVLAGDMHRLEKVVPEKQLKQVELLHVPSLSDETLSNPLSAGHDPQSAIRTMLRLHRTGELSAVVSAGPTGAQVIASLQELDKCSGINRPAVGALLPTSTGNCFILDVGSSLTANAHHLAQFAAMGQVYMQEIHNVSQPRIAILNVARERNSGATTAIQAYSLLENSQFNFVGFVEGRDIPEGAADVVVTNGFTGNTLLKFLEGLPSLLMSMVTAEEWQSMAGKFDYHRVGGELLLGVKGISVICHGASNANAISAAIVKAARFSKTNLHLKIDDFLSTVFSGRQMSANYVRK